jgi:hypothetical protein
MIAPAEANNQFYDDLPAPAAMHQTNCERQTAANRPEPSPDTIHAAPLVAWCKAYGVPLSTLYQLTEGADLEPSRLEGGSSLVAPTGINGSMTWRHMKFARNPDAQSPTPEGNPKSAVVVRRA